MAACIELRSLKSNMKIEESYKPIEGLKAAQEWPELTGRGNSHSLLNHRNPRDQTSGQPKYNPLLCSWRQ